MKKTRCGGGGGCLGAPMRALTRPCDSACDLYVRGMSGCARHVPSGAAGAVGRGGGGYGRSSASAHVLPRASSDRVDDLVRAAATASRRGRRVAPARAADATSETKSAAPKLVPERKIAAAAAAAMPMETIAEDAPCEFSADGTCAFPPPSRRRGVAASGLPTRTCGFGAVKARSSRANKP